MLFIHGAAFTIYKTDLNNNSYFYCLNNIIIIVCFLIKLNLYLGKFKLFNYKKYIFLDFVSSIFICLFISESTFQGIDLVKNYL
ncbi:MAG: hypothetical protein Tsb0014_22140 [Pleurocapsa sp.]